MKKHTLILAIFGFLSFAGSKAFAQADTTFTGAKATLSNYNALYIINSNDDKRIRGTLRNMANALQDPRIAGKLHLELIAFGDGVAVYMKNSAYEPLLLALKARGVILAQCNNTLKERKIDKAELFPFVAFVPTGNGEIILRQYEGWAVVHP